MEALSPKDVWAAGYSSDVERKSPEGTTLTMHWDWEPLWSLSAPAPSPSRSLNIIWGMGVSGSTVWALGHYRGADGHLTPLILELSGTGWLQVPLHGDTHWSATAAAGASPGSAWVIGSEPTSSFAVASCGLTKCRTVITPDSYDIQASSVYAFSDNDAWLVGMTRGVGG